MPINLPDGVSDGDLGEELGRDGVEEPFDLFRPCGRYGFEWISRIPSLAQVLARDWSANAEPLST